MATVADMTRDDWLGAFAEAISLPPPTPAEVERVLELAGDAAHASERTAAPVACWLAGRAGLDLDAALALARDLSPPA